MLTIDSGDTIAFACPNAGWWLSREERFEPRDPELDRGHALVGPVEVRGATAGQTLEVRVDVGSGRAVGRHRGRRLADGPERPARRQRPRAAGGFTGRSIPTQGSAVTSSAASSTSSPFLGVMGMPPPEPGVHSTQPPRAWGGNIDCKELVAGTTLFLPIPVDGRAVLSRGLSRPPGGR